jgi:hypothetical protein
VTLEAEQPLFECGQVGEVPGGECLALDNGEVDLNLIWAPTCDSAPSCPILDVLLPGGLYDGLDSRCFQPPTDGLAQLPSPPLGRSNESRGGAPFPCSAPQHGRYFGPQGDAVKIQVLHAMPVVGFGLATFHSFAPQTTPWEPVGLAVGSGASPE